MRIKYWIFVRGVLYDATARIPNLALGELVFEAWERMTFGGVKVEP